MKIYKYKNYEEYKSSQIQANKAKQQHVWVKDIDLDSIIDYCKDNSIVVEHGICHGVRNGWEVKYLRENLSEGIFGTEISDFADKYENVIQWDFHDVKEEWLGKFDMIYSNSFDHSFKPKECLDSWMSCVSVKGALFLHWSTFHEEAHVDKWDCFGATEKEYKEIIEEKYILDRVIDVDNDRHAKIFIVKNK